jgi:hypothetical protein
MKLIHTTQFLVGHDCINFECKFPKKCTKSNSHGIHGVNLRFLVHSPKELLGYVQFILYTGWTPQKPNISWIHHQSSQVLPADLGYHSKHRRYDSQESMECDLLGECFYDGSSTNAFDAYHTLVNGGDKELWKFLDQYYNCIFHDGKYPKRFEYPTAQK